MIIITINVFLVENKIVKRISEGLCDWSNDAKNSVWKSALIVPNKLFICTHKWILNYVVG